MRILVLSNMYPPHYLGGYELFCADMVDRFRERGHEVTVLTTTARVEGVEDPPGERAAGVRRDLSFYWDDHVLVRPRLAERVKRERANQRVFGEAVAAVRPDVVSVWNMGAMSLGLLTTLIEHDIPIVYVVCDDWPIYGPRLDAWSKPFRRRPLAARAARAIWGVPAAPADLSDGGTFLFISAETRRTVSREWPGVARSGGVVYAGIDRRDFPELDQPPPPEPWRWRLLYAGRLDERKGVHVAVEALAQLPAEATLEVVGRGDADYKASLHERAVRLGVRDRVHFSHERRSVLAKRYEQADAVLFPATWNEPFGLVPIEAMACGTPVIATGIGGSGEYLREGINCLLSSPGDAAALADAVRRLGSDETLRARLVRGGLQTAKELDADQLADVLEAWHTAASERFARGRPADRPSPIGALGTAGGNE